MRNTIRLKKGEDRRIRNGHPWIFSNEIDTTTTPLKLFYPGEETTVQSYDNRLLGSAYVNPHSLITARLFSRNHRESVTVNFCSEQLKTALKWRSSLFAQPFYRFIFSEADGLPGLVIDRFDKDFVMQINTAGMEQKKAVITEALLAVIPNIHSILLRNDNSIRTHEALPLYVEAIYGSPPEETIVQENGIPFHVPLWKGQKTGWFYDHRMNRARLKNYVKGLTVLDVFSYLGGFGIQAAKWGAKQVDCIESSAFASDFILRNAVLNAVSAKINVISDSALTAMKNLHQANKKYGMIILDPPAFVKKYKDRQQGLIAYQRLNELALRLLAPGGILITCSCSMHISTEDFLQILKRCTYRGRDKIQILELGHQGPDHPIHISLPETNYLKAIFARKMS